MNTKTQKPASGNEHHCGTNQDSTGSGGTLTSGSGAKVARSSRHPERMGAGAENPQGRHLGTSSGDPLRDPGAWQGGAIPEQGGILTENFEGEVIPFTAAGAFVNATAMCAAFGKRPAPFLALESTKDFISELEKLNAENPGISPGSDVRNPDITFVVTRKGNRSGGQDQGTWLHPDLALECARWLSPRFAIWTNRIIRRILAGEAMPAAPALSLDPLATLIVAHYRGTAVLLEAGGRGYLNVSAVMNAGDQRSGRRPSSWREKECTQELISSLSRETGIPEGELIEVKKDSALRGTWLHPVLALDCARRFSPDFSFWLEKVIRRVAPGGSAATVAIEGGARK